MKPQLTEPQKQFIEENCFYETGGKWNRDYNWHSGKICSILMGPFGQFAEENPIVPCKQYRYDYWHSIVATYIRNLGSRLNQR